MIITTADKLRCAERELSYRKRVYARLVEREKMSPHQAQEQITLMEAIVEDYKKLAQAEMLI